MKVHRKTEKKQTLITRKMLASVLRTNGSDSLTMIFENWEIR